VTALCGRAPRSRRSCVVAASARASRTILPLSSASTIAGSNPARGAVRCRASSSGRRAAPLQPLLRCPPNVLPCGAGRSGTPQMKRVRQRGTLKDSGEYTPGGGQCKIPFVWPIHSIPSARRASLQRACVAFVSVPPLQPSASGCRSAACTGALASGGSARWHEGSAYSLKCITRSKI
jgi:hypothetical protein